jgi:hypothetical protein
MSYIVYTYILIYIYYMIYVHISYCSIYIIYLYIRIYITFIYLYILYIHININRLYLYIYLSIYLSINIYILYLVYITCPLFRQRGGEMVFSIPGRTDGRSTETDSWRILSGKKFTDSRWYIYLYILTSGQHNKCINDNRGGII